MLVPDQGGQEPARTTAGARELPHVANFAAKFRPVPERAFSAPGAALILINNNREIQGVLCFQQFRLAL